MKKLNIGCDLKSCILCQLCLKDWLPAIELHKTNIEIKKGQHIFNEGDAVKGIFFIYKGKIKVHKRWDEEKELIIRFAQKGDILGQLGLGNDSYYPVSATALESSVVCYISMEFFESTLAVNSNFTYRLMRFFANQLQESEKRMRNLAHMSVKGRIAQSFITLNNQFGTNDHQAIDIELTRQDLASFAGVSYETLFKVINELVQNNIISVADKHISVVDEEKLLQLVHENH